MIDRVAVTPTKKPIHGVPVGGCLLVSGRQARVLVALRRAEYFHVPPAPTPEPVAEVEPVPEPKAKRRYRRKDMEAEG